MEYKVPRLAVLGICERAAVVRNGLPINWKLNLLGLKQAVVWPIYPLKLKGSPLAIAVYGAEDFEEARVRLVGPDGTVVPVTREQMTVFIGATFAMLLYGP